MQTTKTKNATRNLLRVATAIVSALLLVVGLWGPGQLASADDAVRLPAAPKAGVTVSTTSPITVGNKAYLSGKLTGFSGKVTIKPQVWISAEKRWSTAPHVTTTSGSYKADIAYGTNVPGSYKWRVVATDGTRTATSREITVTRNAKQRNYSISRGPNYTDRVVLTFDDCPTSLKAFKDTVVAVEKENVGLALFPTGNCIKSGRFDANFARQHGMHVFNHSITHPDLRTLSKAGVKKELGSPGIVTTYGRPPYGAYNDTVKAAYAEVGMKIWTWTVDTNDWRGKGRSELVSYVTNNAKAGDTVLMHMQWNAFNATAIKDMKKGLENKGLKTCRNYEGTVPAKPAEMWC